MFAGLRAEQANPMLLCGSYLQMKTLIIPDIHNKIAAVAAILAANGDADDVVYLGDFFDDWNDSAGELKLTLEFLRGVLKETRSVVLLGNHDASYAAKQLRCSGWEPAKQSVFDRAEGGVLVRQQRLWYRTQGFVLTHAGVASRWLGNWSARHNNFSNEFEPEYRKYFWDWIDRGGTPDYATVGSESGGAPGAIGGPLWYRPGSAPLAPFPQIFGHTQGRSPRALGGSWCIDTSMRHYGTIVDGVFSTTLSASSEDEQLASGLDIMSRYEETFRALASPAPLDKLGRPKII